MRQRHDDGAMANATTCLHMTIQNASDAQVIYISTTPTGHVMQQAISNAVADATADARQRASAILFECRCRHSPRASFRLDILYHSASISARARFSPMMRSELAFHC